MNQALFARSDLYERAEVHESCYNAVVERADFGIRSNQFNNVSCAVALVNINTADEYAAVLFYIHFNVKVALDLLNYFAAFADHIADLIGINGKRNHLRRVFGKFLARFADNGQHDLVKNIISGFVCFSECLFDDLRRKAVYFQIHLDRGNAFLGAGNFKVHIAEEIFKTLNICQNQVIIIGITGYQTNGNTSNWCLNRNTGSHQ